MPRPTSTLTFWAFQPLRYIFSAPCVLQSPITMSAANLFLYVVPSFQYSTLSNHHATSFQYPVLSKNPATSLSERKGNNVCVYWNTFEVTMGGGVGGWRGGRGGGEELRRCDGQPTRRVRPQAFKTHDMHVTRCSLNPLLSLVDHSLPTTCTSGSRPGHFPPGVSTNCRHGQLACAACRSCLLVSELGVAGGGNSSLWRGRLSPLEVTTGERASSVSTMQDAPNFALTLCPLALLVRVHMVQVHKHKVVTVLVVRLESHVFLLMT